MKLEQMLTGPLVVELTLVKCHQRLIVHPGANVPPQLRMEETFIMNGNVDATLRPLQCCHLIIFRISSAKCSPSLK